MVRNALITSVAFLLTAFLSEQRSSTDSPHIPPQGGNWWTAFGGDDAHTGFKADTLGTPVDVNERWTFRANTSLSAAVVYGGFVYVMSDCHFDGILFALSETTGELVNQLNLGKCRRAGPPTIGHDGLLYVQTVGSSAGVFLYGIAMETFKLEWVAKASSQWSTYPYGVASSAATQLVYFPGGHYNGVMHAVNASTGEMVFTALLYSTGFGCDSWAPAVYSGNGSAGQEPRVFFSTQAGQGNKAQCGEVDAITGKVQWQQKLNSVWSGYSTHWVPVAADGRMFAANNTEYDTSVVAVGIGSREGLWATEACRTLHGRDVSPATDGKAVFLTCKGSVKEFDALTGALLAQYATCAECYGQPIVTKDHVIVRSTTKVHIFQRTNQERVGTVPVTGQIAYHGGWLFVSSTSELHAYQLLTRPFGHSPELQSDAYVPRMRKLHLSLYPICAIFLYMLM